MCTKNGAGFQAVTRFTNQKQKQKQTNKYEKKMCVFVIISYISLITENETEAFS